MNEDICVSIAEMIHYENAFIFCGKKCGHLYKFQTKIKNLYQNISLIKLII